MKDHAQRSKKEPRGCGSAPTTSGPATYLSFLEGLSLSEKDKLRAKMQFLGTHVCAAAELNRALVASTSAPLATHFNAEVVSALRTVEAVLGEMQGDGDEKPTCETKIKILKPPPPDKIDEGTKTIDVEVEYSAQLSDGQALTDCVVNVVVEKIDKNKQKVVDRKLTAKDVDSAAKDKKVTISADSDMNLILGNGVRITATLVCNECDATSDGPKIFDVRKKQ